MELDYLKSIWKETHFAGKGTEELAAMLKGKSNLTIAKLKRSVRFEMALTILCGLILLYLALTLKSGALKWSMISMVLLFFVYMIYYVMKLRVLNRFDPSHHNIRENLVRLVTSMEAYLKFYKISYTVLYPVSLLLGLLFVAIERGFDTFWQQLGQAETILRFTFVSVVVLLSSLFFTKWYLKKLYGNHLDELRALLKDIEDSPTQ